MANIVVPEAASWTEVETERNLKTLKAMGLDEEVKKVQSLRRKGTEDPGLHLAGAADPDKSKGK